MVWNNFGCCATVHTGRMIFVSHCLLKCLARGFEEMGNPDARSFSPCLGWPTYLKGHVV